MKIHFFDGIRDLVDRNYQYCIISRRHHKKCSEICFLYFPCNPNIPVQKHTGEIILENLQAFLDGIRPKDSGPSPKNLGPVQGSAHRAKRILADIG